MSCLGGGRASHFLGILKYCLKNEIKPELKIHILDRDPAWGESWTDVDEKCSQALKVSAVHVPFDVTDPTNWRVFKKHFNSDMFTMIYFMSEVYAMKSKANQYFDTLFASARPGAKMLYIDNNDSRFTSWFDGLASQFDWETSYGTKGREQMPWDEQKVDLGAYYKKFPDPKLTSNVAIRVITKK